MKYIGELYGRIGKKYFPMEKRAEEIDELGRNNELARNQVKVDFDVGGAREDYEAACMCVCMHVSMHLLIVFEE